MINKTAKYCNLKMLKTICLVILIAVAFSLTFADAALAKRRNAEDNACDQVCQDTSEEGKEACEICKESGRDCSLTNSEKVFKKCLFCGLFVTLFNTASVIAKKSFEIFAHPMLMILMIGMAIWIALQVLKLVSSVSSQGTSEFMKNLLSQFFVVVIVAVLLRSESSTLFGLILEPIFNVGFKLAETAIRVTSPTGGMECNVDAGGTILGTATGDGGLPNSMGRNIVCLVDLLQARIGQIIATGMSTMCYGLFIKVWFIFIPDFSYVFSGLLIALTGLFLLITFPFLLLDSVLELAVASALIPLALVAYAFPITRKAYVGKIWNTFLNSMLNFLFLSLIIVVVTAGISEVLRGDGAEEDIFAKLGKGEDFSSIIKNFGFTGVNFLKIIFMCLLGKAVLEEGKEFADGFGGGGMSTNAAKSSGTFLTSGPIGAAKALGGFAAGKLKQGASALGGAIKGRAIQNYANRRNKNLQKKFDKIPMKEGESIKVKSGFFKTEHTLTRMADGTIKDEHIGEWSGKQKTNIKQAGDKIGFRGKGLVNKGNSATVDENGNVTITYRRGLLGKKHTLTKDKDGNIVDTFKKNGNVIAKSFVKQEGSKNVTYVRDKVAYDRSDNREVNRMYKEALAKGGTFDADGNLVYTVEPIYHEEFNSTVAARTGVLVRNRTTPTTYTFKKNEDGSISMSYENMDGHKIEKKTVRTEFGANLSSEFKDGKRMIYENGKLSKMEFDKDGTVVSQTEQITSIRQNMLLDDYGMVRKGSLNKIMKNYDKGAAQLNADLEAYNQKVAEYNALKNSVQMQSYNNYLEQQYVNSLEEGAEGLTNTTPPKEWVDAYVAQNQGKNAQLDNHLKNTQASRQQLAQQKTALAKEKTELDERKKSLDVIKQKEMVAITGLVKTQFYGESLNSSFAKREFSTETDSEGREVYIIKDTKADGSIEVNKISRKGERFRLENEKKHVDGTTTIKVSDGGCMEYTKQLNTDGELASMDGGFSKQSTRFLYKAAVKEDGSINKKLKYTYESSALTDKEKEMLVTANAKWRQEYKASGNVNRTQSNFERHFLETIGLQNKQEEHQGPYEKLVGDIGLMLINPFFGHNKDPNKNGLFYSLQETESEREARERVEAIKEQQEWEQYVNSHSSDPSE